MRIFRLSVIALILGIVSSEMVLEAAEKYQPGYDPETARPEGVLEISESAWGAEVDGLQAAISGPDEMRYNERGKFFLVIRNISAATVKVTLRGQAFHPDLTRDGEPTASGGYSNHNQFTRFEISAGHHIAIPFPEITIVRGDGIAPTHAKRNLSPGKLFITSRTSAGGETWGVTDSGKQGRRVVYPEDEWRGHLNTKPHAFTLLDEEVALEIPAPPEFGTNHDLKPVVKLPDTIDRNGPDFNLRHGLGTCLNRAADSHWFVEYGSYDRHLFWGPFSAEELKDRGLLEPIKNQLLAKLADDENASPPFWEMRELMSFQKPFVEMILDLVPLVGKSQPGLANNGHDFLTRAIRDRRVELRDLGLEKEVSDALETLTADLPPLPPESEFHTVAVEQNPADAPADENRWGPENDGLRAAASIPNAIARGQTADVRLFIRNVNQEPVYLTVSDRPGYDTASASDPTGTRLDIQNEMVYPMAFSSVIRPELDPGLSAQNPPMANLIKLKLEPGAIWELKTKSALLYFKNDETRATVTLQFQEKSKLLPAIATIRSEPTDAVITWELHSANGAQYTDDLRGRIWPAKGGWSGVLHTAPVQVKLVED